MPGCPYFLLHTFGHLLGGLVITGLSTENLYWTDIDKKPITHIFVLVLTFLLLLTILFSDPGPFKYIVFVLFCIVLGQILSGFVKRLESEHILSSTLLLTGAIFIAMTGLALFDKGNMLSWKAYLFVGLVGLIVASIGVSLFAKTPKDAGRFQQWLSWFAVVLFTLFVGYDVQVLQTHAKACKQDPDYVNESINVYLDVLNLFQGIGNLSE